MRFKVDENLPGETVEILVATGHDAVGVLTQQMGGRPDRLIAGVCRSEERALVTFDLDFADIRMYPPQDYPGLIVLRLAQQDTPRVVEALERIIPLLGHEPLEGHLWIADERTVRIRGSSTTPQPPAHLGQ